MNVLAIVAPGQGAQKPAMLTEWVKLAPQASAKLADATGLDIIRLGTTADADEIKDTAVTQPLVVVTALLAGSLIQMPRTAIYAGHSVGELAAAALAGVLTAEQAAALAAARGHWMGQACHAEPSAMAAVMNPDTAAVLDALAERGLTGANVNGGGQIVAAGAAEAIADLVANPPTGSRVIALPVAGAFHTSYMRTAAEKLRSTFAAVTAADPTAALLTNADGSVIGSGPQYLEALLNQITAPVRWDMCMQTLAAKGVTGILELPPAGTLTGLARRSLPGVATLAVKSPADLSAAAEFVAEHA